MNRRRASVFLPLLSATGLALGLAAPAALALQSDRNAPIEIQADHGQTVLEANSESILRGNVQITQGSLQLHADEARFTRRDSAMTRIVFSGSPARVAQQLDSGGHMNARAARIDYDMNADLLLLSGDVVITQPEGELRGERVRYDLSNGHIDSDGGDGGRVHMRIEPRSASPRADD
ncbi:MAG: lipopolysaccharide transport periplasmic protein LptA [Lysobacteraceae bacterium]